MLSAAGAYDLGVSTLRSLTTFPSVVNEKAARVVASFVVVQAILALATGWAWVPAVMATGFALRVLAGPRFSPVGWLAAKVIAPRLGAEKPVPGAPKRFAQAVGLVFTAGATAAWVTGAVALGTGLLVILLVFATLEAALGYCAGCTAFAGLMRIGLVPQSVCVECADIRLRQGTAS